MYGDNGKENGNCYLGFRVWNPAHVAQASRIPFLQFTGGESLNLQVNAVLIKCPIWAQKLRPLVCLGLSRV